MLRADEDKNCGVFVSGFDYTQLIGFLTLSIIEDSLSQPCRSPG
jgi:hypothetical protein